MYLGSLDIKSKENIFAKLIYLLETFVRVYLAIKSAIWDLQKGYTSSGEELGNTTELTDLI